MNLRKRITKLEERALPRLERWISVLTDHGRHTTVIDGAKHVSLADESLEAFLARIGWTESVVQRVIFDPVTCEPRQ